MLQKNFRTVDQLRLGVGEIAEEYNCTTSNSLVLESVFVDQFNSVRFEESSKVLGSIGKRFRVPESFKHTIPIFVRRCLGRLVSQFQSMPFNQIVTHSIEGSKV